jgi:hypothetical protein
MNNEKNRWAIDNATGQMCRMLVETCLDGYPDSYLILFPDNFQIVRKSHEVEEVEPIEPKHTESA